MASTSFAPEVASVNSDLHCPKCSKAMVISRVETKVASTGIKSSKTYECVLCGTTEMVSTSVTP
jgi:hypothetical protein